MGSAIYKFVEPSHTIEVCAGGIQSIAQAARTCYRSHGQGEESDRRLVTGLIENGHHAMLEFSYLQVRFVCDRAIANELVRHRHLSFAQESTRYVRYGNVGDKHRLQFVIPQRIAEDANALTHYLNVCDAAAREYVAAADAGLPVEVCRAMLPLSTATTLVAAGNFREWRHVLALRTDKHAHPQMRELMLPLLDELRQTVPIVFDDIGIDPRAVRQ